MTTQGDEEERSWELRAYGYHGDAPFEEVAAALWQDLLESQDLQD